jgi:site-specific DNA recombinase
MPPTPTTKEGELMTRVCLYTRISTDEDNQPTSLYSQKERLEAFVASQEGWRVVAHEQDQASGAKLDRAGLQQALQLARDGRVDLLLVYRVDRLSRKVRQLAQLAEELDKLNVVLRSASEPFDTGSAAGRMMLQMLAVFAEFEHATIIDRVTAGIERRAKQGRWGGGRLPFGYTRNESKDVIPDERTAPVVKRIFQLYTKGRLGTVLIARKLTDEHAPAPARGWQPTIVQLVLENEAYLGKVIWRGNSYPGLHQPLIDELTFARAQKLLRERGDDLSLRRGNPSDYLLSGLVRCGSCGQAYVGMSANGNGGRYHYYACIGRNKRGPKHCKGDRLDRDKLEHAVLVQLTGLYRDGALIQKALKKSAEEQQAHRPAVEQQLETVTEEIRRAERALDRYQDAFEHDSLDPARFAARVSALDARLIGLRGQEADLTAKLAPHADTAPDSAELTAVADHLDQTIATEDPQQAKALLRLLIKELRVHAKTDIRPVYRVVTPEVRATPSSVGGDGIEPPTSWV